MRDPQQLLEGANLKLKKVRYLTFAPGERIDAKLVIDLTREAQRLTLMSRGERELIAANAASSRPAFDNP